VRGIQALDYDISPDGREVVMQVAGSDGKQQLWLAPLDRSSPPRQIQNVEGGAPRFLPAGEILFRRTEGSLGFGSSGFVYRVHPDGTGLRKALEQPVLIMGNVSPEGKWLMAWAPLGGNGPPATQAFPLDGGSPIPVGSAIEFDWSPDGRALSVSSGFASVLPEGRSYVIPLARGQTLPRIPTGGFHSEQEIATQPGARRIETSIALPGPAPELYAFYRGTVQRNLYRVPIR
jgi:hypothetical protein